MAKRDRWEACDRNAYKLDREIKRACREKGLPLETRQTGSHRIYKVPGGSAPVPMKREIKKGTWDSIMKALIALGIAVVILASYMFILELQAFI